MANPKSAAQLKSWIEEVSGFEVESLNKKMIGDVRSGTDNEEVHAMLDIRQGLAKTSTEKYNAMLRTVCPDGRIRGLTQFCGAARTGRWAGRLVQMQNLPQNKMPDSELDAARRLVREGDLETLEMLFDDTAGTLSQLIRTAFVPKPGCRFIVADFSAIEARVLAWLADEEWRMDVFNTHGKIYEASAEQMFHLPKGSVKKGDPMRQKGKIAELALGYGGSVGAMKSMGALAMGLEESELKPIVNSWRAANKSITKFWWDTDAAVRRCITTQAPVDLPHGMRLRKQGPLMRLRLPNGRELSYVKPRVDGDDNITYEGTIQSSGGWGRIESYGPKFVENIVQATARDCLAEAMFRLEAAGFPIVFHVHDEVICEVPIGVSSAEELGALMGQPISWAPNLPLRADAYETFVWSGAHVHPAHTHEIDDHSHSVRIPSHSHNVTIPGHSHNITIPAHEHDITPGIYFYGSPKQFDLYVNGKKKATIVSTDTELDLTQYLVDTSSKLIPRGSWLSIEVRPNDLAYVSIDMFVQGFVQSRGDAKV